LGAGEDGALDNLGVSDNVVEGPIATDEFAIVKVNGECAAAPVRGSIGSAIALAVELRAIAVEKVGRQAVNVIAEHGRGAHNQVWRRQQLRRPVASYRRKHFAD
jgi:hypothetical protein